MGFGGLAPFPRRFGPSRGGSLEAILKSLLAARGTAYDTGTGSLVYAECMAYARAIWDAWETVRRMSLQWDPVRMTDMLPRWEAIFAISPAPGASLQSRRAAVLARFQRIASSATIGKLNALLKAIVPSMSPVIYNGASATARSHVYTTVAVPGGVSITGDGMWGSSVHHVAVMLTKPASMSSADAYSNAGLLMQALGGVLPAWCTYDWFFANSLGAEGFILDDAANLDNEAFDS